MPVRTATPASSRRTSCGARSPATLTTSCGGSREATLATSAPLPPPDGLEPRAAPRSSDLLTSYRVGFADISNTVLAVARSLPAVPADAVIDLAGLMFTLQNEYSNAVINAYRDEAHELTRSSEREWPCSSS